MSADPADPTDPYDGEQSGRSASGFVKPRYAVVFRTHFWDEFATRQLDRIRRRVPSGDLFVMVDETRGKVAGITTDRVFSVKDADLLDAGYVQAGEGSIQWYSGDVPLYLFRKAYPDYEYYVQLEYDVNVNVSVDDLIEKVSRREVDMVALTNGEEPDWHWLPSCSDAYEPKTVRHQLICLSVFSKSALLRLEEARLEQARLFKANVIHRWPYCEGYIATEARKQGLNIAELSEFGDVSHYEWWPPFIEKDLPQLGKFDFVHPVLDKPRFEGSLLKYDLKLGIIASPFSWSHHRLRRLGLINYLKAVLSLPFRRTLWRSFRKRFGMLPASAPGFNEMNFPRGLHLQQRLR